MRLEDCSPHERPKNLGQKQIRDRAQLISGCGMSGDVDTHPAQLLNQPPDLRPARGNLFRDLRTADHNGCVLHQEPNDLSEPQIGWLQMWPRRALRNCYMDSCPRLTITNCAGLGDAGIIRELRGKPQIPGG